MKKNLYLVIVLLTSIATAQQSEIKKGNKKFDTFAYINAIEIYEKVAQKGYESPELFSRLANSYYFNADYKNASKWYKKLFDLNTNPLDSNLYFRYSNSLKAIGNIEEANRMLEIFIAKSETKDNRIISYKNYIKNPNILNKYNERYDIEPVSFNSNFSEFGSFIYNNNLYFASSNPLNKKSKNNIHNWNKQPFSDIYYSPLDSLNNTLGEVKSMEDNINSPLYESNPVFTKDGKYVYFTRNNFLKGKKKVNSKNEITLKIYRATLENNKWVDIKELPFNNNDFNCAHPSLSQDEKTLYFSSNMPGTNGESDIYSVTILDDFKFTKPENLGPLVNTEGREAFPFISNDNILYFSSDGHYGFGGLDVFGIKIKEGKAYGTIYNLGKPLNSNFDDFAYYIDDKNRGFVSSNRENGKGFDDIYKFKEIKKTPLNENYIIYGNVKEVDEKKVIANAEVILYDNNKHIVAKTLTDGLGNYKFENIIPEKQYFVNFNKENYDIEEDFLYIDYPDTTFKKDAELRRNITKIEVGIDLASLLNLRNIYFDLDKWYITKIAETDLAKIIEVMNQYKSLKIEIRSHTDSRQTDHYNKILSQKRALSSKNWLVKKGINPNRITTKGLGEHFLVNNCKDGIPCSEEQHQQNRRSEFIIISK